MGLELPRSLVHIMLNRKFKKSQWITKAKINKNEKWETGRQKEEGELHGERDIHREGKGKSVRQRDTHSEQKRN